MRLRFPGKERRQVSLAAHAVKTDYQILFKKDKISLAAACGLSPGKYPARWVSRRIQSLLAGTSAFGCAS
jgi:hypothetical protein